MRGRKIITVLLIVSMLMTAIGSTVFAVEPTIGRQLKNIPVLFEYNDYRSKGANASLKYSTWGSVGIAENGKDDSGNRAFQINSTGSSGLIMFIPHNWQNFSLEQYYENGVISFNIRGASGGEGFRLGIVSTIRGTEFSAVKQISQFTAVTNEWQRVSVPIKALVLDAPAGFSLKEVNKINIYTSGNMSISISDMYITSKDNERQPPVIKVNQVGYETEGDKHALVGFFPGTVTLPSTPGFEVVARNGEVRYSGNLEKVSELESSSGETVYRADFSAFQEEGAYRVRVPGANPSIADSWAFNIGRNEYAQLLKDVTKYYYYQRQGTDLLPEYAGVFARKNLHPSDSRAKLYSQRNDPNAKTFDVSKGWYDAGDYGKYVPPAATAVTNLLFTYEMFPQLFYDGQTNIPESGNGIPDLLDEIKWQLDFILSMQDEDTGGFYDYVSSDNADPDGTLEIQRYIRDVSGNEGNIKTTAATADGCAVLAHAYIVLKEVDAEYANRCLGAARRAWCFIKGQASDTWLEGGAYLNKDKNAGEKFWAASVMFRATGEQEFNDYVLAHYTEFSGIFNAYSETSYGSNNMAMLGYINYALTQTLDNDFMKFFRNNFSKSGTGNNYNPYEKVALGNYSKNPWKTPLPDWAYFWGANGPICLMPVALFMGNKALGNDLTESVGMAKDAVNYILGANPLSFSYISGEGENSIRNTFSSIYKTDGIDEVPSGYMAGGANQYNAGMLSNYPSKCYIDSSEEYTTNEHTIYWNSGFVLCLAIAMQDNKGLGMVNVEDFKAAMQGDNICRCTIGLECHSTDWDLVTALYKGNKLVGMKITLYSSDAKMTVDVPCTETPDTAKVFVWNGLERMDPYSMYKTVQVALGE